MCGKLAFCTLSTVLIAYAKEWCGIIFGMNLNTLHSDWFRHQKVTPEVLESFKVNTHDNGMIAFPVFDSQGNFIFNKYRRSPENTEGAKYTYDTGGSITLYGWHLAKDHDTILITEGEKDCLVAWSHNIPAVTSTGGAMSFQPEWVELFEGKTVVVCFDNDKAGGEGMAKVYKMFEGKCKLMFIPERADVKDISDYVMGGGDLHKLMRTAKVIDDIEDHRSERVSMWKSTWFHDAILREAEALDRRKKTIRTDKNFGSDIERAKAFPIPSIIDFVKGKAMCPFHNEKTPSLHYYEKTNTTYCFGGCGKSFDAVDIYQKKFNVSFKDAVNELKNM